MNTSYASDHGAITTITYISADTAAHLHRHCGHTHIDAWPPCHHMAAVIRNLCEMTNVIAMSDSHTPG